MQDKLKELLLYILMVGHLISRPELLTSLVILAEHLQVDEILFTTTCADLIEKEFWDEFLAQVKQPLLESENYELLKELYL